MEQADVDRQLAEKKKALVGRASGDINVDRKEFISHLTEFRRELFDLPNHY